MGFEKRVKRKILDWQEEALMKAAKKRNEHKSNKRNWREDDE
jgi:hypothetical protein